jgi:hypothetical protein
MCNDTDKIWILGQANLSIYYGHIGSVIALGNSSLLVAGKHALLIPPQPLEQYKLHWNQGHQLKVNLHQSICTIVNRLILEIGEAPPDGWRVCGEVHKVELYWWSRKSKGKHKSLEAKLAQAEVELEMQRAQDDEEYANALAASGVEQIQRSEELIVQRLIREDEAARKRTEDYLKKRIETSQLVEQARMEATEMLSAVEHERSLETQWAKEKMKAERAKAVAAVKVEAERANEDVHLRRMQTESEQRQKLNIAVIQTIFANSAAAFSAAVDNPAKVFTFIRYVTLFFAAFYT